MPVLGGSSRELIVSATLVMLSCSNTTNRSHLWVYGQPLSQTDSRKASFNRRERGGGGRHGLGQRWAKSRKERGKCWSESYPSLFTKYTRFPSPSDSAGATGSAGGRVQCRGRYSRLRLVAGSQKRTPPHTLQIVRQCNSAHRSSLLQTFAHCRSSTSPNSHYTSTKVPIKHFNTSR